MDYKIYRPETDNIATNLWNINVANLTGDVTHTISDINDTKIANTIQLFNDKKIANAERISIQIDWANLSALNAIFYVKTKIDKDLSFVNEQSDETEQNATQKTLSTASGSKIFHLAPANYQALQLFLQKNSIATGSISVSVSIKW